VDHELIKDEFSRRAYVIDGVSALSLSRRVLPARGCRPTIRCRDVGIQDDGHLHPVGADNTTDIDLPRHILTGEALTRAFLSCDCGPANRQQLPHPMAMVTSIRGIWLLLSLMLASQVVAGELGFTVTHLEHVQSFETSDDFQLALLAHTPEMNIRLNKLRGRIKRHAHPQSHHFFYLIQGQIELTVGDETKVLGTGDFVTIPRETPHAMKRIGDVEALLLDVASPPDAGDVVWYE
jgi:mannose-6-phosphate isomerase-like protein (cupin superfamily)